MDQLPTEPQRSQVLPHIVQVYQTTTSGPSNPHIVHIPHPSLQTSQGTVTYQQTITSDTLNAPVSSQHIVDSMHNEVIQNQQNSIIVSCPQPQLQNMPLQTQILQRTELGQPLQIASHVIMPQVPVFKHQTLVNGVPELIEEYQTFHKLHLLDNQNKCQSEKRPDTDTRLNEDKPETEPSTIRSSKVKRSRSKTRNPSKWASNIRKLKHQRGEAYISRRGKYVAERRVIDRKDCSQTCKVRCSDKVSEADRELIFKAFYSLNYSEKKHFLLNTTERNLVLRKDENDKQTRRLRTYSYKYFFLLRGNKYIVCKMFYLGTLAISQKQIYDVHMNKTEVNTPKPDARGLSATSIHGLPLHMKERVRNHISSFKTIDSSPVEPFSLKRQYLDAGLSIKQMYGMYLKDCQDSNVEYVKESMYRKIFKVDFNLVFKKWQNLCCRCKETIKK